MTILITGAGGFVGKALERHLGELHTLRLISHSETETGYEAVDLSNCISVEEYIDAHSADCIDLLIHAASKLASADMSDEEQMRVFEQNIDITKNVAFIIKQLNIKRMIHCSTMAVYPNESGEYNEKSEIRTAENSEGMYGLSKFSAENIFDFLLGKQCDIIHLRLAQIHGRGMREDRIIPQMISAIKRENKVEVYGNGERTSCFISVERVVEIVSKLINMNGVRGVFNVGDDNISYYELAHRLIGKYGNSETQLLLVEKGSRAKFVLNTDKINKLLRSTGELRQVQKMRGADER